MLSTVHICLAGLSISHACGGWEFWWLGPRVGTSMPSDLVCDCWHVWECSGVRFLHSCSHWGRIPDGFLDH